MRFLSEQDRRQRNAALFAGVAVTNAQVHKEATPNDLSDSAVKVLVKAALEPGVRLLGIYSTLGLHAGEGKSAVDELVGRGMVRVHRLVRKGRGAQPHVLEVLPEGVEELAKRGITPAVRKCKGGFKHDLYVREIAARVKESGGQFSFEKTLGGKTFDGIEEDKDGKLTGYEVVLSGSAKWNAMQTLKAAGVAGIQVVVVACESQKLLRDIQAEWKKLDELGLYRGKVDWRLLGEFVGA